MTIQNINRRRFVTRTVGGVVLVGASALVDARGRKSALVGPDVAGGVGGRGQVGSGVVGGDGGRRQVGSGVAGGDGGRSGAKQDVPGRPPALAPDLVRDFVQKAHADLAGTQALLAEQPALLNATWDWGGGDFETGIGGAGHMGNREIAEFLISKGARFDLFVAAMLGRIEVVRAVLTAWPELVHAKGPHGISLMRHARAGGEPATAVVSYLESKGAA